MKHLTYLIINNIFLAEYKHDYNADVLFIRGYIPIYHDYQFQYSWAITMLKLINPADVLDHLKSWLLVRMYFYLLLIVSYSTK